jgi:hypothetical protein
LAKARLPAGGGGMARLHAMIGKLGCDTEVAEVAVGSRPTTVGGSWR